MIRTCLAVLTALFVVVSLSLALPDVSDAARMGGGRSFGSQPFMRSPARAPSVQPSRPQAQQAQPGMAQPGMAPGRGGLFSGFGGGFLGGMLAGSLIGSLLGGGHYSGVGFMDIILLLLVVGLVVRFLKRRRAEQEAAPQSAGGTDWRQESTDWRQQQTSDWRDQAGSGASYRSGAVSDAWGALRGQTAPATAVNAAIPADFDTEEFLQGAKMAYARMQASWDRRDLDDIANFANEEVMEVLREQLAQEPEPTTTELVLVQATLLSVEEVGDMDRAKVYFDVLMREDPRQPEPTNAREFWYFVRKHNTGNWKLDGIQQVQSC